MTHTRPAQLTCLLLLTTLLSQGLPASPCLGQQHPDANGGSKSFDFGIGGCGGVYFLASPGELVVDLYKRDRNRHRRVTELRAILFGPDRQVLDEIVIPDTGQSGDRSLGSEQRVRLSTHVKHQGIFGLSITVSQDRYGDEIIWGFRTNCERYLIETSRGHRDRRREEPIVLLGPDRPGNVCFLPSRKAFAIEVTGLPKHVKQLALFDGEDQHLHTLNVNAQGAATHTLPADQNRGDAPWRLELPSQQATIHIDGVTRWTDGDSYVNLPYWTPNRDSFFPFLQYRWLLTPYRHIVYGTPGTARSIAFQVHNNSHRPTTIQLEAESDTQAASLTLSQTRVTVPAHGNQPIGANVAIPATGTEQQWRIRATPTESPEFSTYSTLIARAGRAPTAESVDIPIALKPYQHENAQFGYAPDYPVESQMYFDLKNRPFVRQSGSVSTYRDDHWQRTDLRKAASATRWRGAPVSISSTKIAFDADNDLYVLGRAGRQTVLLHSTDGAVTFSVYPITGREGAPCTFDIEQFSGHNVPHGPPAIVRYTRTAADPNRIWRRINDLELIVPTKADGRLTIGEPILLSRQCIGLSSHSGIPSSVVSRGDKIHVAWGEATDPAQKVPGVPTYVVTYDRVTGVMGEPALVGHGPPANDIHNSPSITIDSQGYLHILVGTHGHPFPYCQSLKANDAAGGWTEPELVGNGRQTYIGMVCGADDTLHAVFRMWRNKTAPHPLSIHATLAYQRKPPGQPWEAPRVLIVAPFSEYSIFYHRLTIDRVGRLFLSYDYWSTYWFYRTDHRGDRRALLMSPDGGRQWKLVETADCIKHQ